VIQHEELALGALEGRLWLPGRCVRIGGHTPAQGVRPSAMEVLGARNGQLPLGSRCLPPPSPKPHVRQSVVARAEDACRVWEGLLSGCSTSDLYQTPQKVISCRDVEQQGSAAGKHCWASLLETDEQNTEHAENANTNMGKCDDYTISPEKL
jgi:hypothetical protein